MTRRNVILLIYILAFGFSCMERQEPDLKRNDDIRIYAQVKKFQSANIETKGVKLPDEALIHKIDMYIFANGTLMAKLDIHDDVYVLKRSDWEGAGNDLHHCRMYLLANFPNTELPSLVQGTSSETDLVNMIYNISEGLNFFSEVPSTGLPMLGKTEEMDLSTDTGLTGNVTIDLENIFAKVSMDIEVDPVQEIMEGIPFFLFESYQVVDIPRAMSYKKPGDDVYTDALLGGLNPSYSGYSTVASNFTSTAELSQEGVKGNALVQGQSKLKITFYIPEYKYNPTGTVTYPSDMLSGGVLKPEYNDYRQNFKPLYVGEGDHATHVILKGKYTNHQGHERNVTYTIYLGCDNWHDFRIMRNHEYKIHVSIRGNTNSKPGDDNPLDVSCDHRVEVDNDKGFSIGLERETLLDSHIEIRPIRITYDESIYDHAEVSIQPALEGALPSEVSGGLPNWLRLEKNNGTGNKTDTYAANGKRLYFFDNLVTDILASNVTATPLESGDCVWVYVDENCVVNGSGISATTLHASTGGYRDARVRVTFYKHGTLEPIYEDFTFRQWDLYKVTYDSRAYFIERYEEYLHSYDSKDVYTNPLQDYTQQGIAWGLVGEQLSYDVIAFLADGTISLFDNNVTYILDGSTINGSQVNARYDFYNFAEIENASGFFVENQTYFPRSGQKFTKEVIEEANQNTKISHSGPSWGIYPKPTTSSTPLSYSEQKSPLITLSDKPMSAVQYVLLKNKVTKISNNIYNANIKWYLPAIDEMEEIVMGAYTKFDTFQDNFYWSSQPAYIRKQLYYQFGSGLINTATASYFIDNPEFARATKVLYRGGGTFNDPAQSDDKYALTRDNFKRQLTNTWATYQGSTALSPPAGITEKYGPGYQHRSTKNRVRAVYNGTGAPTVIFNMN